MKIHALVPLLLYLVSIGCSNDDNDINPLRATELLHDWEISARGINNVSSLEALCCETIKFTDDSDSNDMKGNYMFDNASGIITNGTFVVNVESNIILYTSENNNVYAQEYSLNSDTLEVWYFEDGDRIWTQYNRL